MILRQRTCRVRCVNAKLGGGRRGGEGTCRRRRAEAGSHDKKQDKDHAKTLHTPQTPAIAVRAKAMVSRNDNKIPAPGPLLYCFQASVRAPNDVRCHPSGAWRELMAQSDLSGGSPNPFAREGTGLLCHGSVAIQVCLVISAAQRRVIARC